MKSLKDLKKELKKLSNPKRAEASKWFFKTGIGEYGEGDIFIGTTVPNQRGVAKKYGELELSDVQKLLNSKIHEERLTALFILVNQYEKADEKDRKKIYNFYLKNSKNINNWDLVDSSAHKIVGSYLLDKDRNILYKLVKSSNIWERRISVVATIMFINNKDFKDSIKIAKILLKDKHDLIHKAVGWMLREVGKKDNKQLEIFLDKHSNTMPRTMLRYSIERLNDKKRKHYMKK